MHLPINVKSPNNISKWQMEFNSSFKGLKVIFPHQFTSLFQCFIFQGTYFTDEKQKVLKIDTATVCGIQNVTITSKHIQNTFRDGWSHSAERIA
jgi:hypothetical protein